MKNKNEPNSSFKTGFLLVALGENGANGLATKRSLIMRFGGCGGCVYDQNGEKWPPTGEILQIAQKSDMKALFCSRTHTKTYSKEFSSREWFCRVVGPQNTLK